MTLSRWQRHKHCFGDYYYYVGDLFLDKCKFEVEDIEAATAEMKRGKAASLDELTIKHLCCWTRMTRHDYKREKIGMYALRPKIYKYLL